MQMYRRISFVLYLCIVFLCACGNTDNPSENQEPVYALADLLPEDSFTEIIYHMYGEGVPVTDPEIIEAANVLLRSFRGTVYVYEEQLYGGWYKMDLVYPEETITIVVQNAETVWVDGKHYLIEDHENLLLLLDIMKEAGDAAYEAAQNSP